MRDELAAVQRAKQEFMANIGHELRTPMNAILGFTQLLLREPLTGDQQQKLRCVHRAAISLLGLMNNLLDYTKLAAGQVRLSTASFSPRTAAAKAMESMQPAADDKGLAFDLEVGDNVPESLWGDGPASVGSSSTCWTTP